MNTEKIKPLLPTLREKNRYLLFKILSKEHINSFEAVNKQIWHACSEFLGIKGLAQAGLWVLPDKYDKKTQAGIIKTGHRHVHDVKTALALIDKINGQDVVFQTLNVSGTLKKVQAIKTAAG